MFDQSSYHPQDTIGAEIILATKLYRPPTTSYLEPRARLLEQLDHGRDRPLTLISAPAGYGKTTLAGMWLDTCDCTDAWISLDEDDNDLRTFALYLLTAVQNTIPQKRLETQDLLDSPLLASMPILARSLLNDLDRIRQPLILVLDDLHVISEPVIYDLLAELLRHPSRFLHLILITRQDPPLPIALLRARGQITEIRARDLRFTTAEAAQMLSNILKRDIDEAIAVEWTERTEGWVTALQLAALSLLHRSESDEFKVTDQIAGPYLQEYLLAEVLAQLSPSRQLRLLSLSILDRFCAPLCDALCPSVVEHGEHELTGTEFMRWLTANNLFLISLDNQNQWFRFHQLFRKLLLQSLQERFKRDDIVALHGRASRWLDQNGLWDEALQHLLASGDNSAAVQFIVEHRYDLMNTQQWQRLNRWLRLLPDDEITQSPHLMSIRAHLATHMYSNQSLQLGISIQKAEHLLAVLDPENEHYLSVRAEIAVNQGVLDLVAGNAAGAMANAQQSLQLLPDQAIFDRLLANSIIAASLQMQRKYRQGLATMMEILSDPNLPSSTRASGLHHLTVIHFLEGDLNALVTTAREFLQLSEMLADSKSLSEARHQLGVALYLRNNLEEAESHLHALIQDRATSASSYLAFGAFALALIHLSRGQFTEAVQLVDLVHTQFVEYSDKFALMATESFRVELALRMGDHIEAQRLSLGVEYDSRSPHWFFYVPQLTQIKLLLAEATSDSLAMARASLEAMDERMAAIHRNTVRIDVLSLLALVCDAQGDESTAFSKLTEALHLGEPGGFIRNFVDLGQPMAALLVKLQYSKQDLILGKLPYISRILGAFLGEESASKPTSSTSPTPKPLATPFLAEPLTEREIQVLKLLATELSQHEIAHELGISVTTVRTHTRNLYGKLDVHSRSEAVHCAQALDLR